MLKLPFWSFLLLLLLLGSCSAKYHTTTDQIIPARVPVVAQQSSLMLLDRAREANLGLRLESGVIHSPGNQQLLGRCARKLPVSAQVFPKGQRDSNAGSSAPPLPIAEVREFGGEHSGLLCLEQSFVQETRTYINYNKHQLDEQGKDYYVPAVRATKRLSMNTNWRLYDVRTGRVLAELPYSVEAITEAEALNQTAANTKLDTLVSTSPEELQEAALALFLADVLPTSVESNWLYHSKGGSLVERSAALLEANRYYDAVRLFEANANQIDRSKKPARAYLNWATALFLDGRRQDALSKARQGYQQHGGNELSTLINKISNND